MIIAVSLTLIISFVILMCLKVPISISIATSALITILIVLPFDMSVFILAQKFVTGIDSFSLLAVPFFLFSGVLMNNGGIAERLVNFAKIFVGKIPGGLAHTNILGNMMFGSISGSSVAAAAAIGGVMGPLEEKEGYDKRFSAAANIASAPTGLLIPPTGVLIIYSLVSGGTSVSKLFLAGYIPGILWGLACMFVAYIYAKKHKYKTSVSISTKLKLKIFFDAIPSLFLIFIIIGGILSGIFTATEAAAVSVAYTLFLSCIVYRTVKLKDLKHILIETTTMTAIIMFLVAASSVMSWVMAFTGIPTALSNLLLSISDSPIVLLLIMNVFLLIIGTFMDITPAVLIFTPIFLPIVKNFGMDPIHFGIMIVMNLSVGNITPPVGSALFVGCSVANLEIEDVTKQLIPFYVAIIIMLLLVTFIPALSMTLPNLIK